MISDQEFWGLFVPSLFGAGKYALPPNNTIELGNTSFGSGFGLPWDNKTRYSTLTQKVFSKLKSWPPYVDMCEKYGDATLPFGAWWSITEKSYVSIDANAQDGLNFQWDLQKPIEHPTLLKAAEVLLDFGTLEHVKNQYPAWKNAHDLSSNGCIMIHSLPADEEGSHVNHCYHWYNVEFFEKLSEKCGYEVVLLDKVKVLKNPGDWVIWASLIKTNDSEFISEEEFNKILELHVRSEYEDRDDGGNRHGVESQFYHLVEETT